MKSCAYALILPILMEFFDFLCIKFYKKKERERTPILPRRGKICITENRSPIFGGTGTSEILFAGWKISIFHAVNNIERCVPVPSISCFVTFGCLYF